MKSIARWTVELLMLVTLLFFNGTSTQSIFYGLVNRQTVLFSNSSSCEYAEYKRTDPTEAIIAKCQSHQCTIEEGFLKKITFDDTRRHLVLKSAKYSDTGVYAYICNGTEKTVKLDVLAALNVTALGSENITLHCYAENTKDVTWFHNYTEILHRKMDGYARFGKGFENRVLLEEGCFEDGDLSLTIFHVSKRDAGLYRCFVNEETIKGTPHAYVLDVNEKHSSPRENHQDCNSNKTLFLKIAVVVLGVIIAGILLMALYKLYVTTASRSGSGPASHTSENNAPETEQMLMNITTTCNDERQLKETVTQPVQETECNPKSSSTQPF